MAGYTVPVSKGAPTQLGGAPLSKGTSIYNSDSVNAVWIGTASVAPGNGQLIGPLGSGECISDGLLYACLDTGNQASVNVVISTDVGSVSNPVALAAATATILLKQGIPTVALGSLITNTHVLNSPSYTVATDLSTYASLAINLFQIGLDQLIVLSWLDAPGGNLITTQTYLATAGNMAGAGTGANLKLTVAVKSPTLRIDFIRNSNANFFGTTVLVYASTRLLPETVGAVDLGVDYPLPSQAYAANTPVFFGNLTTNGGLHSVRCFTNGAGAGWFGYETCDVGGITKNLYLFKTAAGQDAYTQMVLPRGALSLWFLTAVVGTFVTEFAVTPGGN